MLSFHRHNSATNRNPDCRLKSVCGHHRKTHAGQPLQLFLKFTIGIFCVGSEYSLVFKFYNAGQPSLCKNSCSLDQHYENCKKVERFYGSAVAVYTDSLMTGAPFVSLHSVGQWVGIGKVWGPPLGTGHKMDN